ncbi:UNKNOWN [Stylonychia lemnae]|uniref:Uncharacterized protein n=1 Tax=Stylonychia lemnae TaxID=5949 RepID=A0A077ZZD1_STYLE|nr:UNKNOWN [Stylonychia lemnae]|eukprot:CDW75306.1 UNKNOWN [Stylonychia lemnae]
MDSIIYTLHIQSNQKMISNLEFEFKRLNKIKHKLIKHNDLEFILPKKIFEIDDQINCEKAKALDLAKQSRIYDKEISRLMNIQESGQANRNSNVLILIEQYRQELKDLDVNPELELLKIKKIEIQKIQSVVKKEQMQQEIDQNIFKIDQDLKRKMKEQKRRIQTIKKWKLSNKCIVDFKMKENVKMIDSNENQIKELQQRLNERVVEIKEQRNDIERLQYYTKIENQNELMEYINEVLGYDNDGIILEEGIEEDQSNLAAAQDLLKELDKFDQNSLSLIYQERGKLGKNQNDIKFNLVFGNEQTTQRSQTIEEELKQNSFDYKEQGKSEIIEEQKLEELHPITIVGEQNEQSIFETQSNSYKLFELRGSPFQNTHHQKQSSQQMFQAQQNVFSQQQQFVNPIDRMRQKNNTAAAAARKMPKSVNPLMTANENAMRMHNFRANHLESDSQVQEGQQQQQIQQQQQQQQPRIHVQTQLIPEQPLIDLQEVNQLYRKSPSQLVHEIYGSMIKSSDQSQQ